MTGMKRRNTSDMPQSTANFACAASAASILIICALNELSLGVLLIAGLLVSVLAIRLALTRLSPHTERT